MCILYILSLYIKVYILRKRIKIKKLNEFFNEEYRQFIGIIFVFVIGISDLRMRKYFDNGKIFGNGE